MTVTYGVGRSFTLWVVVSTFGSFLASGVLRGRGAQREDCATRPMHRREMLFGMPTVKVLRVAWGSVRGLWLSN